MLFLNRRGYAGFVSCRECGYVVKCPHCDVALSAHKMKEACLPLLRYERPSMLPAQSVVLIISEDFAQVRSRSRNW